MFFIVITSRVNEGKYPVTITFDIKMHVIGPLVLFFAVNC